MKKFIFLILLIIITIHFSCKKEASETLEKVLIGTWECDSTVLGSQHSMFFKSKKYEFHESGEFKRVYGAFGMWDFGNWNYVKNTQSINLIVDSVYEDRQPLFEELIVHSMNTDNMVLIEDYDSIDLGNGHIEFIKEYYTKKK